jgi:hypothetical protein
MRRLLCVLVLTTGLVAVPARALPPSEKIVIVDQEMRALLDAARRSRLNELDKAFFCAHPDDKRSVVECSKLEEASPGKQAAYHKALVDVGRSLTDCESKWSGYQSMKDVGEILRIMGSKAHHPDGGATSRAVEYLRRADEETELARRQYQAFKQAGCVVMRKDGFGNPIPLRADDRLGEWS